MKGLAALVFESVPAPERVGAGAWIRNELAGEPGPGGPELVERLLSGTRRHAERRQHEMQDVQAFLSTLHTPAWMTESTIRWLRAIAAGEARPHPLTGLRPGGGKRPGGGTPPRAPGGG